MKFSVMMTGLGLASLLSVNLIAETTAPATTQLDTSVTSASAQSTGRFIGGVDLRPTYGSKIGEFHSENYAQVGYEFSKSLSVGYRQEFNTNLYHPSIDKGLDLYAKSGFARVKINDLWKSGNTSFGFESRLYFPTEAVKRDAGQIFATRNYARLRQKMTSDFTLMLEEYPIFHVYNRASFNKVANPWFENRVALTAEYFPFEKVKLLVPLYLESTRFREAGKAKNSDRWSHKVYLWPELDYIVSPQLTVGVAYQSGYLFKDDLGDSSFSSGFEQGLTQITIQAAL